VRAYAQKSSLEDRFEMELEHRAVRQCVDALRQNQRVISADRLFPKTGHHLFENCTCVFGSKRLTGAWLNRGTHHIHMLEMKGER
jgi:hypothetical protein